MSMDKTFELDVLYAQIAVFESNMQRPFNQWAERHVAQGFSWRPGSTVFRTIEESGKHFVEVMFAEFQKLTDIDAIRIIDVPFEVSSMGSVEISSILDCAPPLKVAPGIYQIRFECYKVDYSGSSKVRMIFAPSAAPRFQVVRADSDLKPGGNLLGSGLIALSRR